MSLQFGIKFYLLVLLRRGIRIHNEVFERSPPRGRTRQRVGIKIVGSAGRKLVSDVTAHSVKSPANGGDRCDGYELPLSL
jgi:hypothetical protein